VVVIVMIMPLPVVVMVVIMPPVIMSSVAITAQACSVVHACKTKDICPNAGSMEAAGHDVTGQFPMLALISDGSMYERGPEGPIATCHSAALPPPYALVTDDACFVVGQEPTRHASHHARRHANCHLRGHRPAPSGRAAERLRPDCLLGTSMFL
jgi:hypothetical protein